MAFDNPLVTVLKVFQQLTGKLALNISGGPDSQGNGTAVIQMYSGASTELFPSELTAYQNSKTGADEVIINSPGIMSDPTMGRGQLIVAGGNNTPSLKSSVIAYADSIYFGADPLSTLAPASQTFEIASPEFSFTGNYHQIDLQQNSLTVGRQNITSFFAGVAPRAGAFPCYVAPIGSSLALVQAQITVPANTLGSMNLFTLPSGFWPTTPQDIACSGQIPSFNNSGFPHVEIGTNGVASIHYANTNAGSIISVYGVISTS